MKRSFSFLAFALVAITNLLGQVTKTPVCYAYLPGRESTLKYKFSYGEEKFYTNLRFIKGSENAFKAGDRIIMKAEGDKTITFSVKEEIQSYFLRRFEHRLYQWHSFRQSRKQNISTVWLAV